MSLIRFRLAQLFPMAALITAAALAGCASSTVLQSQPPGARVFLNNVPVGTTPYTMTDYNTVGTATAVRLEYPGYQPLNTYIVRNEELDALALIGGLFLLVPFLWVLRYNPSHYYQLQPAVPGMSAPGGWGGPEGYPPPQGGYVPPQGGYPEQQPQPGGYPPGPAGYPPPPAGYPPPAGQQPQQPQQ
ncbi:MAG TPA: PEGA domain-containing protein [Polyangia bacterium]|nr:PEGA domain-containing protein [Polyangia bacterium]